MSAALYQEMLLAHHRNPIGFEKLIASTAKAAGENASCGDEIEVEVKLTGNVIEDLAFSGDSCAICRASASMMNKTLVGEKLDEVVIAHNALKQSLRLSNDSAANSDTSKADTLEGEQQNLSNDIGELGNLHGLNNLHALSNLRGLGKLTESEISSLLSVSNFPVRVQCAMLPWNTLHQAIIARS